MIVYGLDTAILLFIGRVPLAYNVRNLIVRWQISVLTAMVFTAVVGLLTGLLAFVNGMYALAADSGQPGNVLVLAEGQNDEVVSNLGYSDVAMIGRKPQPSMPMIGRCHDRSASNASTWLAGTTHGQ